MRVLMLAWSEYDHDARVQRSAASLADVGHDVRVVVAPSAGFPAGHVHQPRDGVVVERMTLPAGLSRLAGVDPGATPLAQQDDAPVVVAPPGRIAASFSRARSAAGREARIWSTIAGARPDVVHVHDVEPLRAGMWVARRCGADVVLDLHELAHSEDGRTRLSRAIADLTLRALAPRAAAVMTVGPRLAEHLTRRYSLPIPAVAVRNMPVRTPRQTAARTLRELTGLADVPLLGVHLGGLSDSRGAQVIVDAVGLVEDVAVVFVGTWSPELRRRLEAVAERHGAARRIAFVPRVPTEQVVPLAATADFGIVAVQPTSESHRLCLPNKLLECMAAGLPVVVSALPEMEQLAAETGSGLVVQPPSSSTAWAQAFRELADGAAEEFERRARRAAVGFDWHQEQQALLEVYGRLGAVA